MISRNIQSLRKANNMTQEALAERVGVSRQAVAKWESGETVPDLANSAAIAEVFGVTLDALVNYDDASTNLPVPPPGKHLFGTVKVGERGQIVIPKAAREVFDISAGDTLIMLGDESQGIALVKSKGFVDAIATVLGRKGSKRP